MTSQRNQNSDDTCDTGLQCAQCCELIPSASESEIHTREVGDVVYHFCGSECYRRWMERGRQNADPS